MADLTPTNPSNNRPSLRELASTTGSGAHHQNDHNYTTAIGELRAIKSHKPAFPPSQGHTLHSNGCIDGKNDRNAAPPQNSTGQTTTSNQNQNDQEQRYQSNNHSIKSSDNQCRSAPNESAVEDISAQVPTLTAFQAKLHLGAGCVDSDQMMIIPNAAQTPPFNSQNQSQEILQLASAQQPQIMSLTSGQQQHHQHQQQSFMNMLEQQNSYERMSNQGTPVHDKSQVPRTAVGAGFNGVMAINQGKLPSPRETDYNSTGFSNKQNQFNNFNQEMVLAASGEMQRNSIGPTNSGQQARDSKSKFVSTENTNNSKPNSQPNSSTNGNLGRGNSNPQRPHTYAPLTDNTNLQGQHQQNNNLPNQPPMPPSGDQYQNFLPSATQPAFYQTHHPGGGNSNPNHGQPFILPAPPQNPGGQAPAQIHYHIANKQQFYQISPARDVPMMFGDKRPYTSSQIHQQAQHSMNQKRSTATQKQSSAIAALYLGSTKPGNSNIAAQQAHQLTSKLPAPSNQGQQQAQANPNDKTNLINDFANILGGTQNFQENHGQQNPKNSSLLGTPYQPPKKRMFQNNSVPRKSAAHTTLFSGAQTNVNPQNTNQMIQNINQMDTEQIIEDSLRTKQMLNAKTDEVTRLKTRVKVLEAEMSRKEKSFEELLQQTVIQNLQTQKASEKSTTLGPMAAQRYQQETFLVMSLKKQVKELKTDLNVSKENVEKWRRGAKVSKFVEMETELECYKVELIRMRKLLQNQLHSQQMQLMGQQQVQAHLQSEMGPLTQNSSQYQIQRHNSQTKTGQEHQLPYPHHKLDSNEISTQQHAVTHSSVNGTVANPSSNGGTSTQLHANSQASSFSPVTASQPSTSQQQQAKNHQILLDEISQRDQTILMLNDQLSDLQNLSQTQKMTLASVTKQNSDNVQQNQIYQRDSVSADNTTKSNHNASNMQQTFKKEANQLKKQLKVEGEKHQEANKQLQEVKSQLKASKTSITDFEGKLKDFQEKSKTQLSKAKSDGQQIKQKEEKIQTLEKTIKESDQKVKSLKDTIAELSKIQSQKKVQVLCTDDIKNELQKVAPILSLNQKITDRLTLAQEIKQQGFGEVYAPSETAKKFIDQGEEIEIAMALPELKESIDQMGDSKNILNSKQVMDWIENYLGKQGEPEARVLADDKLFGKDLTETQKLHLMARYLTEIKGSLVYINTVELLQDVISSDRVLAINPIETELSEKNQTETTTPTGEYPPLLSHEHKAIQEGKKHGSNLKQKYSEEQMLDIAELCFIKMSDSMIKQGRTVQNVFLSYAQPELMPDGKTMLELISPPAFLEACKRELKISEFTEVEVGCLMRVLSKPELEDAIILNEFALIMENFGVPILDGNTISEMEEQDYTCEGETKPRGYDMTNVDLEGIQILKDVARFLLKEYLHPREFFGKYVKPNQEYTVKQAPKNIGSDTMDSDKEFSEMGSPNSERAPKKSIKTYRVDILKMTDFYLRVKVANIRKMLTPNESLDKELCLDPKQYSDVFNMKVFVRALEEIAEVEQERMAEEEEAEYLRLQQEKEKNMLEEKSAQHSAGSDVATPVSDRSATSDKDSSKPPKDKFSDSPDKESEKEEKDKEKKSGGEYDELSKLVQKPEHERFSRKKSKQGKSPHPASKMVLGTIEEAASEGATTTHYEQSQRDDESRLQNSTEVRSSHGGAGANLEHSGPGPAGKAYHDSVNRVDILNKSLNGNDVTGGFDAEGSSLSSIGRNYGQLSTENLAKPTIRTGSEDQMFGQLKIELTATGRSQQPKSNDLGQVSSMQEYEEAGMILKEGGATKDHSKVQDDKDANDDEYEEDGF